MSEDASSNMEQDPGNKETVDEGKECDSESPLPVTTVKLN